MLQEAWTPTKRDVCITTVHSSPERYAWERVAVFVKTSSSNAWITWTVSQADRTWSSSISGLPKKMAVLFEPFIIRRLKEQGLTVCAQKLIERQTEV